MSLVVRIRWPKGVERITTSPNDTIGSLIAKMAEKHQFSPQNRYLILDRANQRLSPKIKLNSLGLENGEMFTLDLKSLPSEQPTIQPEIDENVQRFQSQWGRNAHNAATLSKKMVVIETQSTSPIRRVLIPDQEAQRISHYAVESHFVTPRIFILYGTRPHDDAIRIHSVSLPSQSHFHFNENHIKASDALATAMGLIRVGIAIINSTMEPRIVPDSLLTIARLVDTEYFTIITACPDAGKCHLEAFQLSEQFLTLYKDDMFVGTTSTGLRMKEQIRLFTKPAEEADVAYFLVTVAIKSRDSWFPRIRFPYQALYPTVADLALAMNSDSGVPDFIRLLDFNLLLFLEPWFQGNIASIAQACIDKKDITKAQAERLKEVIASAALLTD